MSTKSGENRHHYNNRNKMNGQSGIYCDVFVRLSGGTFITGLTFWPFCRLRRPKDGSELQFVCYATKCFINAANFGLT